MSTVRRICRIAVVVAAFAAGLGPGVSTNAYEPAPQGSPISSAPGPQPSPLDAPYAPVAPGMEIVERRTASTKTFATDVPGAFRTRVYDGAVHFTSSDGRWRDIDTTLVKAQGRWRNAAHALRVELADDSGDEALGRVGLGDDVEISWRLQDARPGGGRLAADGVTVTYPRILPNVDLVATSRVSGVKEDLVLMSPRVPDRFVYPLSLRGVTADVDDHGDVVFRDSSGVERARMPRGFMEDARIDPHTGRGAISDGVVYRLVDDGDGAALEVRIDRSWLDDPDRAYPVRVDPSFQTYAQFDDTFVASGFTANSSALAELNVGTWNTGTNVYRSFMHFDGIAGLNGKTILSATLFGFNYHSWSCSPRGLGVYRITQGWNGTTMTGYPGATFGEQVGWQSFAMGYSASCPDGWMMMDIKNTVHNWTHGVWSNFGLMMKVDDVSQSDNFAWKVFASRDTGTATGPHIDVTYSNPPNVPVHIGPASGSKRTSMPTLSATYSHPDARPGSVVFSLRNSAGTQVASAWSALVNSGQTGSWTPPAQPEGSYTWITAGQDNTGTWSAASSPWSLVIDPSAPPAPSVSSSTHPVSTNWYRSTAPTVSWSANDLSEIAGYSYVLDQSASTTPDTASEGTGTTRSYTSVASGSSWLHVRAQNGAGLWGSATHFKIQVDAVAPSRPAVASSHAANVPSSDRTVDVSWSGASDAHSGVQDYAWVFNNSQATPANPTSDPRTTATARTSAPLSDGTWWFHVLTIDRAGNTTDEAYGPLVIDGTGPGAPVISSVTHPDPATWDPDTTATFTWTVPSDTSGLAGYSVVLDEASSTTPPPSVNTSSPTWTQANVSSGDHWLHVTAIDVAGNASPVAHYQIRVDGTLPTAPEIVDSTSHSRGFPHRDNTVDVTWTASYDAHAGLAGYSWTFNTSESVAADNSVEGTSRTASSPGLADGTWWLHVRAIDRAGNPSPDRTFGPLVIDGTAIDLPTLPGPDFADEACTAQADYYDLTSCAAPADPAAPPAAEDPDGYRALYGYVGPYFTPVASGGGVVVLPDTVTTSSSGSWRAWGLVRNETSQPVGSVTVVARLYAVGDVLLGETAAAVPVSPLRPHEPAPFTLSSSVLSPLVLRVEYSVVASGTSSAPRQLEMFEFWHQPYGDREAWADYIHTDPANGPYPYLVSGTVRNASAGGLLDPGVVGAWLDADGRVVWVQSAPVVSGSGVPLAQLAAGKSGDFEIVVDDPDIGPRLNQDGQFAYWGVQL